MPRQLLDLENEILSACLAELLPQLTVGTHRNPTSIVIPPPLDLCRLMVVSKLFRDLALPLVWRRMFMSVDFPRERDSYSTPWECLCHHPGLAPHIRFLQLQLIIRTPESSPHFQAFYKVASLMTNLRVLLFQWGGEQSQVHDQINLALLTRPHLHTLDASLYRSHSLRQLPGPLTTLKRLHIADWDTQGWLLDMNPCIDTLALQYSWGYPPRSTVAISWVKLHELTIHNFHDWYVVMESFLTWKNSFPDSPPQLLEFSLCVHQLITLQHVQSITVFGPQLRALHLIYLEEIDKTLLSDIVMAFPQLQELRLLAQSGDDRWKVNLPVIIESLVKLPMLKCLHWNYIRGGENWIWDHLGSECRDTVQAIAPHCRALELCVFYRANGVLLAGEDEYWISFAIPRSNNGGYEEFIQTEDSGPWQSFTSGWDFSTYNYI